MTGPGQSVEPMPLVPPALSEDLRALHAGPGLSPAFHRAVMMTIERELDAREVRRRNLFRFQRLAALAAGVAIFLFIARLVSNRPMSTPVRPGGVALAPDVNGDGMIDILDAQRIAVLIAEQSPDAHRWDVNRDGRVDGRDVDAAALRAVRLTGAGATPAGDHASPGVRFTRIDVFVDPGGAPLGAYQVDLQPVGDRVTLVGVEGGDAGAFADPPYHDPAALSPSNRGRVILAACRTVGEGSTGPVRVARLHVRTSGDAPPKFDARLAAAADPAGTRIKAGVTLRAGGD